MKGWDNTAPNPDSETSISTMNGLDRGLRMGAVVNAVLSLAKALSAAWFHSRCLSPFLRRDVCGMAREFKHQIKLLYRKSWQS